jgi:predicted deacylase
MRRRLAAVTLAALSLSALGCNATQLAPTPMPAAQADGLRVSFAYKGNADLTRAVGTGFDLHGVDTDKQIAYGKVDTAGFDAMKRLGLKPVVTPESGFGASNTFDKGYRTYEQVTADLKRLADKYPDRLTLKSIGQSYETTQGRADRQLWAIRITGAGDASRRPAVSFTANLHARELAPVETAMTLIERLAEGYDKDPAIKKLVDTRVIYVAPMLNPDGHHKAEGGADWRKNTHDFKDGVGVDLNRNFPFKWGGPGTSGQTSSDIFRGPSAASEPETQAVVAYLSGIPNLKIGMDFHSYSNLVMWSWGWTADKPQDSALLSTIGKKLASFNHYKPMQACDLYLTSGSIRDFCYGQLHVPYFTTEMGGPADGFDPPYARAKQLVEENMPGSMYLISIADNPAQVLGRSAR